MITPTLARRDPATHSLFEKWLSICVPPEDLARATVMFVDDTANEYDAKYRFTWEGWHARPNQLMPTGEWFTWLIRAGRGYGKTRTGAEAVRKLVGEGRARAVTIIGPTAADARDVMIEGPESGLLAVHPTDHRPVYKPSNRTLEWPNGAIGRVRSAEDPDSLRGLNSELVWGDEPASWRHGSEPWDNAMLGNRVGKPHAILTGTPRPLRWLKDLEAKASTRVSTGSTYENATNLADTFIELVLDRYEGTRLGRQELHALYLEDVEGALWTMAVIEATRLARFNPADPWTSLRVEVARQATALGLGLPIIRADTRRWRTLVGVDPPGETAECGIIAATAPVNPQADDHAVILDDASTEGPPEHWAAAAVACARRVGAEAIVVESNQGGDMTRAVLHNADPDMKVIKVTAKESKYDRAEPVSVLWARGRAHLGGFFKNLEDQMTTWVQDESKSPDRLDAMVHVVTALVPPIPIPRAGIASPLGRRRVG